LSTLIIIYTIDSVFPVYADFADGLYLACFFFFLFYPHEIFTECDQNWAQQYIYRTSHQRDVVSYDEILRKPLRVTSCYKRTTQYCRSGLYPFEV